MNNSNANAEIARKLARECREASDAIAEAEKTNLSPLNTSMQLAQLAQVVEKLAAEVK